MNSPALIEKKCECCGKSFKARVVDHEKGWGRFCSKSCSALFTSRTTRPVRRQYRGRLVSFDVITSEDLDGLSWT